LLSLILGHFQAVGGLSRNALSILREFFCKKQFAVDIAMGMTSMLAWSVGIVPMNPANPAGPAAFQPRDAAVGTTLEAWDGDTVTWDNTKGATHQPWPTDANYVPVPAATPPRATTGYMSDPIPAAQASRPAYPVLLGNSTSPVLVHYCCLLHPT
jgi:hypothetical protein